MKRYSFWLCLITALSTVFNLAANLVSGRIGYFGYWVAPMGVFFFPFIYVLSDVTSDVYGYQVSRWIAWWTALSNFLLVGLVMIVLTCIRCAEFAIELDKALRTVLATTFRVSIASIIGAVLGGWTNDVIFQVFRHKDGIKHFARRKLISSVAAECVDTVVFITLAFAGTPGWAAAMYFVQFTLKYLVEVVTCPVASRLAWRLRTVEGEDVFEDRNKFNIFGITRKEFKQAVQNF